MFFLPALAIFTNSLFNPLALSEVSFQTEENKALRRIEAHLLLEDFPSALLEAKSWAEKRPDSPFLKKSLIQSLAASGFIKESIELWHQLEEKEKNLLEDRNLLEEIGWGVLQKETGSTQYGVRLAAGIGSFLTKDSRAIPVLIRMMRDSNAIIRSVAVQMASVFQDAPLKDEIRRLMREEKIWVVRLEVMQAVGKLNIKELEQELKMIVQSEEVPLEERQVAIEALLRMYDEISMEEFLALSRSSRAGLRHLACSIALHLQMKEAKEEVLRLIEDPHPSVRIAALNAFGLVYKGDEKNLLPALKDSDPFVAITASWAAFLIQSPLAEEHMSSWLASDFAEYRQVASAALASTGSLGSSLALRVLKEHQDPYVRANLALGLLGQRIEVKTCSDCIYHFLQDEKRLWMIDQRSNPLFEVLAPSKVRYNDQIPNFPEAQDQMTRLKLVSLLAHVEDPRALEALKTFLQRKHWGVSGAAAATLLHEGDASAFEGVEELTHDQDPMIRLQACLVLAMFSKDETVLEILQEMYHESDHEKKLYILEALTQIGGTESFLFFLNVLKEPFPVLRVAAAAALIQSVNR